MKYVLARDEPMADSVGSRLIVLMAQANVKSVAMAKALGVSKAAVAAWRNNTTSLKGENQDAVVAYLNKHGANTTKGYLMFGEVAAPTAPVARPAPVQAAHLGAYTMDDIKRLAALYNARRSQQAPASELDNLYGSLWAAVRAMVSEQSPSDIDDDFLDDLAESFVERFTRPSQQPRAAIEHPAKTAHRKRRP